MGDAGGGEPPPDGSKRVDKNLEIQNYEKVLKNTHAKNNTIVEDKQPKNKILYMPGDKGPFFVYLESTDKVGYNIGKSNNIKIARDIFNLNLTDVVKISSKGLNRMSIQFVSMEAANSFTNNKRLLDKGYNIYIPYNFVTSKGIARRVDIDISEEEILETAIANNNIKILNVRRLNRRVNKDNVISYEPTGTILFTFQGVRIPKEIKLYYLEFPIEMYVPPVTQCFRCLRYGHTRNNCKGKEKCFKCAAEKHFEDLGGETCETCCFFCKDTHVSTSKQCPEYTRQKHIKELMAYENLTFFEANEKCKKTYSAKGDFIYNPSDFPTIKKNNNNLNFTQRISDSTIEPSQRRTQSFKNGPIKRSFQQTVSANPTKKRLIQKSYDRKAHEEILYFPNSRQGRTSSPDIDILPETKLSEMQNSPNRPLTSAVSHNSLPQNFDINFILNFLKNTTNYNKNICRKVLQTDPDPDFVLNMDQGSDSEF